MGEADDMEFIYSLIGYPNETEWIEFKEGTSDPERIGRDISALANVAAYLGRPRAYKIWGVEDDTHALVGTQFDPYHAKGKAIRICKFGFASFCRCAPVTSFAA